MSEKIISFFLLSGSEIREIAFKALERQTALETADYICSERTEWHIYGSDIEESLSCK